MLRLVETVRGTSDVGATAVEVLRALFESVTGAPPSTLRAYRDDDVLLLLLRFPPSGDADPPFAVALPALAQLVSEAVAARTGEAISAESVNVNDAKGLAVLAFAAEAPAPAVDGVWLRRAG